MWTASLREGPIVPPSLNRRISRFAGWLILLFLAGFALRLGYVISQKHHPAGGDGWQYSLSADLAAQGHWFEFPAGFAVPAVAGGPDAAHPPLWTAILSVVSVAGGNTGFERQICAVIVGASAIPLVGLAGRKIAGERVALIAAALAAVYPGLWQYERVLLSEVVLMPLIALVLLLAYWYHERPSLRRIVLLSAVCALLSQARAEQLALFVLLVFPLVVLTRTLAWKRRIGWLAASAAVALLLFAPWATFNATRFKEPVLISTGLGGTMAAGACDATFSGDLLGHWDQRPVPEMQADPESCVYPHLGELASLDRSESDLRMRRIALRYTRDHLRQLPKVIAAREGRTFSLYRPFQEVQLDSAWSMSATWVGYVWTAMYWVLAPLALAGAVLLRRRRVLLYPLLVEFVIVVLSAATTFGQIRYRAAAEIPLLILSAVALDRVWKWWSARSPVSEVLSNPTHEDVVTSVG